MSNTDVSGSDASESDVSNRIGVNLNGLNMDGIEVDKLCNSDDSGRLDSAHESNLDGQNWLEFNLENDMINPRLKMILEARGKPILTMIETIRTKNMFLIVKKKEEADKWK
ncbi:Putative L-type lectin-domain containing receptor kinase V.2 [Gossypium arboreum]|uniref:Putative L-type lectin-domain containing receptor kinase V.2 n=1 Tax=Gossypium arboreum TaxID=29729 RepID=A0A0B0PTF7_GOSAR|nr:Putative L-type lectin-domain containing receptor kinase V.2 [Gossypium arboreum]